MLILRPHVPLRDAIEAVAEKEGVSINRWVCTVLANHLRDREVEHVVGSE